MAAGDTTVGSTPFYREDAVNWNPTWNRADNLSLDADSLEWLNLANNKPQIVWHGAGGAKLWTGKYEPESVNAAWRWVGGGFEDDWIRDLEER